MSGAVDRIITGLPVPEVATVSRPWPTLDEAAFIGPAGSYALAADQHTEADPVAVLITLLGAAGAVMGGGAYIEAGNDRHPPAIWPVLVGATSKGGKGTSYAAARAALYHAAPVFFGGGRTGRVLGGFNSGEAVVDALRDAEGDDPGAKDKRLLVYESEFARLVKAAGREGSTLSQYLRDGWDQRMLETRSRAKVATASDYHLVVLGHITVEELRNRLNDVETYGGFSNRFLWCCVRRSKRLPEGGNVPDTLTRHWGEAIGAAIAKSAPIGRVQRTDAARRRWAELYDIMGDDDPGGLLGAVIARAEPMTLRLSLLYSLLDGSNVIDLPHLEAAWAVWRFCRASAEYVFGEARGDPVQDKLLSALRDAGEGGLTYTEQSRALGSHCRAADITAARKALLSAGLIIERTTPTEGRPVTVNVIAPAKEAEHAKEAPLLSLPSHDSAYPWDPSAPGDADVPPEDGGWPA
jgi:hypothetical protein